ncbi:histidine kinase [Flavobacteriaceae bacterium Ap0902]|nr:histidine kinase [Flavobacteriaceae bacterium Ap0902]
MKNRLNSSDYQILTLYLVVNIMLLIIDYVGDGATTREFVIDIPVRICIVLFGVYVFINWWMPMVTKYKKPALFLLCGISTLIACGAISHQVGHLSAYQELGYVDDIMMYLIDKLKVGAFLLAFPLALILFKKYYEGQIALQKLQNSKKENELKILRAQINPHFLFNNLNTLDRLIDSDTLKAKKYIQTLSQIYRYLIQSKDAEFMELSAELQFAKNYIQLIHTSFGRDYQFNINIDTSLENKIIPTGSLQSLIENIIKHNKALENQTIISHIDIHDEFIRVSNELSKIKVESSKTGLKSLQERYQLLFDKKIEVIQNTKFFIVKIPIISFHNE